MTDYRGYQLLSNITMHFGSFVSNYFIFLTIPNLFLLAVHHGRSGDSRNGGIHTGERSENRRLREKVFDKRGGDPFNQRDASDS